MARTIKMYGETFEVIKPRKRTVEPVYPTQWDYTSIWQAYDKPSIYKEQIWDYWDKFGLSDDEQYHIGVPFISSRNCFSFVVVFNVYERETMEFVGVARITKDYNRLYLVR